LINLAGEPDMDIPLDVNVALFRDPYDILRYPLEPEPVIYVPVLVTDI
jgi:hypothetical protein